MAKKTYYITTAIDYVNAEPHIGHAYQKIVADVLARWQRLQGNDVFFLTGTDEHGKKIANSAESAGKSPQEFVNEMSKKFETAWKALNIIPDRFIRTTDKDHIKTVEEFVSKMNKSKDIYKGHYEGTYCTACETYYTEKECPEGVCHVHHKELETIKEETYFFKLSKYQKFLLNLYKKNPEFVLPNERRNEIINRVKEGLNDLSITRTSFSWGIPFPLDKKHVIYVWYDALINYYTAINNKQNKKYWPANVHLLGKDNGWFHAVIWPAMLKSAGIKLPKTVFIHGFLTFNGEKISKSLGNAISPVVLANKYGADTLRYFSLRQFPFANGDDGDFSESALVARHNNELADKLGNLVSRISTLAEKYGIKKCKNTLAERNLFKNFTPKKTDEIRDSRFKLIELYFNNYEFDKVLNEVFTFIDLCNEYVQKTQPWKSGDKEIIYELADSIKDITILLSPFIPETAEKISKVFNFQLSLKSLKSPLAISKIKKAPILFNKIIVDEDTMAKTKETKENKEEKFSKKAGKAVEKAIDTAEVVVKGAVKGVKQALEESKKPAVGGIVQFSDWEKIDLRVAKVKKAEDIEGADKLFKLTLDVGELGERIVCAGLKGHYTKEELKGKKLIYFENLNPRMMRGINSQGMVLAAVSKDHSKVVLLSVEKDIDVGSKIS